MAVGWNNLQLPIDFRPFKKGPLLSLHWNNDRLGETPTLGPMHPPNANSPWENTALLRFYYTPED